MIRNIFHKIKKCFYENKTDVDWVPDSIKKDDTFVVSYPKSGNTWVRFLLANALYPDAKVDFHTIHELIPEVGNEETRRSGLPRPRLFKSHAPYQPAYPRVRVQDLGNPRFPGPRCAISDNRLYRSEIGGTPFTYQ